MKTVTIHDAKSNLSKYIAAAKTGQKIYIGSFGRPEVIITKIPTNLQKKRDFSTAKNKVIDKSGSFSHSTDEAIAKLLYGN